MAGVLLGLTSCNDDKDELTDSRLTYYADLQLQGDEFMAVPVGTPFVDPGCTGTLAGEDITSQIKIVGADDVDTNTLGFYDITYTAYGSDGYPASVTRTVCVYDPSVETDISGEYAVQLYIANDFHSLYPSDYFVFAAAPIVVESPTGIDVVERGSSATPQGPVFDLSGRRVQQPQKGIYLYNGNKVLINERR